MYQKLSEYIEISWDEIFERKINQNKLPFKSIKREIGIMNVDITEKSKRQEQGIIHRSSEYIKTLTKVHQSKSTSFVSYSKLQQKNSIIHEIWSLRKKMVAEIE